MSYIVYVLAEIVVRLSEKDCMGCKDKKKSPLLHLCRQVINVQLRFGRKGLMQVNKFFTFRFHYMTTL